MSSINKRFTDFQRSYGNKPYERQKDSLEVQLSSFLSSLVPSKKLSAATAEDIVKFLIYLVKTQRENRNSIYPCVLQRSVIAQSVWQLGLWTHI